jgi:hypothetical protein
LERVAAEWVGVALAVAKMLSRAANHENIADALDDAHGGLAALRAARPAARAMGTLIAKELERQLGGASGAVEADLRAAAEDVAELFRRFADNDNAVLAAATYPDQFLEYARKHGGGQKRRLMSERAALAFDHVLEVACAEFAQFATSSSRFFPAALAEILRQLPAIDTDARPAADGIGRQAREDRDVVVASRDATNAGTLLGRPVSEWKQAELGVHVSIVLGTMTGPTPYILRNHDAKLRESLAELKQMGARARLITVIGTSCSGKTRALYEAIRQVMPDWNLVKPADIVELTRMLYAGIPGHTVVWLDELQNFLTNQSADAARAIHRLLDDSRIPSIVFAATIWPTNLTLLEQRPDPAEAQTGLGEISNLIRATTADRYEIPRAFTEDQLAAVDTNDPRIAKAIRHAVDGQVTQVLAGGTQLVDRVWPTNQRPIDVFSPAGRAVILAAADLRRIGYPNPVPRWAIAGAAPGYLDLAQRHRLNRATWIKEGLVEATEDATHHQNRRLDIRLRGVPALTPLWLDDVPDATADPDHYELHDYLLQHHLNAHRHTPTIATLWNAVTASNNLTRPTPHIAVALGWHALHRGLYSEAVHLLTIAANAGYKGAQDELADLLLSRGDEKGLHARANAGDVAARDALARLLAERDDEEGLRARADRDLFAQHWLAELLGKRGDEEGLRILADQGNMFAEDTLDDLEELRDDYEQILRARADSGDRAAVNRLVNLLADRGDEKGLQPIADSGHWNAKHRLARLQAERGDETRLRVMADGGDRVAALMLHHTTLPRDEQHLRARADAGDQTAEVELSSLLFEKEDKKGLSVLADRGNPDAQARLARLLAKRGAVKELKNLVHATYWGAAEALIELYQTDRPDSYVELDVKAEPRLIMRREPR